MAEFTLETELTTFKIFKDKEPDISSAIYSIQGRRIKIKGIPHHGLFVAKTSEGRLNIYSEEYGLPLYFLTVNKMTIEEINTASMAIYMNKEYLVADIKEEILILKDKESYKISEFPVGKIKFQFKDKPIFEYKENIESFVNYFKADSFFDTIYNHKTDVLQIQKNTLYIYTQVCTPKAKIVNRILMDVATKTTSCIDIKLPEEDIGITENAYQIFSKETLNPLAILFPEFNSAIICDVSHELDMDWFVPVWEKIIELLNLKKNKIDNDFHITIGSDPEFEQLNNELKVIPAHAEFAGSRRLESVIGTDGHRQTLEIRPSFSINHKNLVGDIKNSIYKMRMCMIGTKGDSESIGAHLHFGVTKKGIVGVLPQTKEIISILDYFLGKILIPLNGKQRKDYMARNGQKMLGNYRIQPHGFEYRSLPSAIFSNPRIARIVLYIAKTLAEEYYHGKPIEINTVNNIDEWEILLEKYTHLSSSDVEYLKKFVEKKEDVKDIKKFWISKKQMNKIPKINVEIINTRTYDKGEISVLEEIKNILTKTVNTPVDINIYLYYNGQIKGETVCGIQNPHHRNLLSILEPYGNKGMVYGIGNSIPIDNIVYYIRGHIGFLFNINNLKDFPSHCELFPSSFFPSNKSNYNDLDFVETLTLNRANTPRRGR